jgi:hypothetical protein
MKNILLFILLALSVFTFSCSEDVIVGGCSGAQPRMQIVNHSSGKADVQIKTSGGSTENINNILSGKSSEWRDFAVGSTELTITIQGVANPIVHNVKTSNCCDYIVTIYYNNTVSTQSQPYI